MSKNEKTLHVGFILAFAVYFVLLFYFLFFAESMGRSMSAEKTYHYNLVLFKEIRRFWTYRETLGMPAVILNLFGNIAAFVPFGALLPSVVRKCRFGPKVVLMSFELSLLVETLQLVTKVGSFDVDDMLLNTIGGLVGYICFKIAYGIRRKINDRNETKKIQV